MTSLYSRYIIRLKRTLVEDVEVWASNEDEARELVPNAAWRAEQVTEDTEIESVTLSK